MSLFRGQRIKALSFSLSVFFLVSTSSSGEEFSNQVPVGHGFWGPQGEGQNASSKVISLTPAKIKNSKTVNIKEKSRVESRIPVENNKPIMVVQPSTRDLRTKQKETKDDIWTLGKLIKGLLANHGLIKAAEATYEAAGERTREAYGAWFPNLVVGSHVAYEDHHKAETAGDVDLYSRGLDFTATQLLWDFGGGNAGIKIAKLGENIAKNTIEITRQDLLLRAITAYLNLKKAGDTYGYAVSSEQNIKKQTELENALVKRGAGLSSDVMQAKQQLAAASALRVQTRGAFKVARNAYRAVFRVDPPPVSKMKSVSIPVKLIPSNLKEALEIAVRENPKLAVANTSADLASKAVDVTRSTLFPRFEIVGTAKHKDNQGGTPGIAEEYSGKLQMSWPINLGGTGVNSLSAAKKDALSTNLQIVEQRYLIEEQVRNAWDSLYTARTTSAFLRNQANIAAEFLEVARKERKGGDRTLLEVLAGETALIAANSAARAADADIRIFAFTLLNAIGRLNLEVIGE